MIRVYRQWGSLLCQALSEDRRQPFSFWRSFSTSTNDSAAVYERYGLDRFVSVRRGEGTSSSVQWMCCKCRKHNALTDIMCVHCNCAASDSYRTKFPPTRQVALFPQLWICESCGHENKTPGVRSNTPSTTSRQKFFCQSCREPFSGIRRWSCPSCEAVNSMASIQCSSCFLERPHRWNCSQCKKGPMSVFVTKCTYCSNERKTKVTDRTQICRHCGTMNDVRSELCEFCVAPLQPLLERASPSVPLSSSVSKLSGLQQHSAPVMQQSQEALRVPQDKCTDAALSTAARPPTDEPDGSWWCGHCNVLQRRNATFCDICLRSRGGMDRSTNGKRPPLTKMGEWQCPYCRQFREVKVTTCCGKSREVPEGYWLCSICCSTNRRERPVCLGCGKAPPEKEWNCSVCGTANTVRHFECVVCLSPHPLLWECHSCRKSHHHSVESCSCGGTKKEPSVPLVCPICGAPNASNRRACFRCRGRLLSDHWECDHCKNINNSRTAGRCAMCCAPRQYNLSEITWICDLCSTAVASGGDLPDRLSCPKCSSPRTQHCFAYPSRWICKKCKVANKAAAPICIECSFKRTLTAFKTCATCCECFAEIQMDEKETCPECGGSLSSLLTSLGEPVSGSQLAIEALETPLESDDDSGQSKTS